MSLWDLAYAACLRLGFKTAPKAIVTEERLTPWRTQPPAFTYDRGQTATFYAFDNQGRWWRVRTAANGDGTKRWMACPPPLAELGLESPFKPWVPPAGRKD